MKVVCVSGGFDPFHNGHAAMFKEAMEYGAIIVLLNSDEWLLRKKSYVFMPWEQRRDVLLAIKGVINVSAVNDDDGSVCEGLQRLKPDYFANGGDRTEYNTPELELCQKLGIEPLFNIGGAKIASSTNLVSNTIYG